MYGGDPIGAFRFYEVQDENDTLGRNPALWEANAKTQTALRVLPTHKGVIVDHKAARAIRDTRGTLHYARGVGWASQKLVAATTLYPVYGGPAWTTLQSDDDDLLRAFALWAHSTLSAVVYWTRESHATGQGARAGERRQANPMPRPAPPAGRQAGGGRGRVRTVDGQTTVAGLSTARRLHPPRHRPSGDGDAGLAGRCRRTCPASPTLVFRTQRPRRQFARFGHVEFS